MLLINCKNYTQMSDDAIRAFVKDAQQISQNSNTDIVIAPPQHLLKWLSDMDIKIMAQHVDASSAGSSTGHIIPELLKNSGIYGSIINHSEHRIPFDDISKIVDTLRDINMISVVCTQSVEETISYAKINPDYVAIEPPELIGTGKSISTQQPALIRDAHNGIKQLGVKTKLLCGAGIVTGQDVSMALDLGSIGVLVASGVVKADNPTQVLEELAGAF